MGPLLFNFSASHSGGGYKRLFHYAQWFDAHGSAAFIIHPQCAHLTQEFPRNRYFVVKPSAWSRLWNDCGYLREIRRSIPSPALYYSYGIPIYWPYGKVNWFHLSNALPVAREPVPLSWLERGKFWLLGRRIRCCLANADVISAESEFSLELLGREHGEKLFLSGNGGDEELARSRVGDGGVRENVAVIVGTYRYKALGDSMRVFEMLRQRTPHLRLRIFGPERWIPNALRDRDDIDIAGIQPPSVVIDALRKAKYYISATRIENSSNADLEGSFLAEESYLSDIAPHREMLAGSSWEAVTVPGVAMPMLKVRSADLTDANLRSWQDVVGEMLGRFQSSIGAAGRLIQT